MEHSAKFEKVKKYYKSGMWNKAAVQNAVGKWITKEEANEILKENEQEVLDIQKLAE